MTSMETPRPKAKRSSEPRVRESAEVRRKSLIQAAMRSIAKYGYAGSTIEKICDEAQVSRGLINHHFQSKDELIRQAYKELCDEWSFQTRDMLLTADRDPEEQMRSIIRSSFGPALFKHDYIGIWVGFVSVIAKSPTLKRLHRELLGEDIAAYQKIFEAISAKRGLSLNARLGAIGLLTMIDGLWTQWYLDPTAFTAEEAAQTCFDYVERLCN